LFPLDLLHALNKKLDDVEGFLYHGPGVRLLYLLNESFNPLKA